MFIFSKSLKRIYKNRQQIAHAVLADRIGKRDQSLCRKGRQQVRPLFCDKRQRDDAEHHESNNAGRKRSL